jgi:hypothetical protein
VTVNNFLFNIYHFKNSSRYYCKFKKSSCKMPLILADFNQTCTLSADRLKRLKYEVLYKSVKWEPSCSMRTDGRTDVMKLIATFRNFANASEKSKYKLEVTKTQ